MRPVDIINPRHLTVVLQGGTDDDHAEATIDACRRMLPGARIILSTWDGAEVRYRARVDLLVCSADPGPLPGFKWNVPLLQNNVNRQIVSSRAGLDAVDTEFALKMRLDCRIESLAFLALYARYGVRPDGGRRILAGSYFTVDPRMFEQMPFHVSDWFHFGPANQLRALWSAPLMTPEDSTYYDRHPVARHSNHFDRRYRTRYAPEQQVATHYARTLGYTVPAFHNDTNSSVMAAHDEFIGREWLLDEPHRLGIRLAKYDWARTSGFQALNCILFADWYLSAQAHVDGPRDENAIRSGRARVFRKRLVKRAANLLDPLLPMLEGGATSRVFESILRTASGR